MSDYASLRLLVLNGAGATVFIDGDEHELTFGYLDGLAIVQ
jgi:hypothetical protein